MDNTSKILNQVSFFSNSHLDAEEIKDIDDVDEDFNIECNKESGQKEKRVVESSNGEEDEDNGDDDDDHKKDVNFISELYQKFMFKNVQKAMPTSDVVSHQADIIHSDDTFEDKVDDEEEDNDEENDQEDESESIYSQWSKQLNSKPEFIKQSKKKVDSKNENNKFSKSFEVGNAKKSENFRCA